MILRYICPKDLIRILVKKDQRTESANILPSLVDCRVLRVVVILYFILFYLNFRHM